MKDKIIEEIRNAINKYNPDVGTRMTRILNAEHTIGEVHALTALLKDIDFDAWMDIVEEAAGSMTELLNITEQAYKEDAA